MTERPIATPRMMPHRRPAHEAHPFTAPREMEEQRKEQLRRQIAAMPVVSMYRPIQGTLVERIGQVMSGMSRFFEPDLSVEQPQIGILGSATYRSSLEQSATLRGQSPDTVRQGLLQSVDLTRALRYKTAVRVTPTVSEKKGAFTLYFSEVDSDFRPINASIVEERHNARRALHTLAGDTEEPRATRQVCLGLVRISASNRSNFPFPEAKAAIGGLVDELNLTNPILELGPIQYTSAILPNDQPNIH